MKITLEPTENQKEKPVKQQHPTVTIEVPSDSLTIDEVLEIVITPALQGYGFSHAAIEANLGD